MYNSNMKIIILGDIIIDQYVYGTSTRLSPEAPVPVVIQESVKETLTKWKDVTTNGSFLDAMTKSFLDRIHPLKNFDAEFRAFVERFATIQLVL